MKLSVIVGAFNMARELPRTIRSLSPLMQRNIRAPEYEVIVVDNGSTQSVDLAPFAASMNLRVLTVSPQVASPSPAASLNQALSQARGELIGVMIDGARMASPGLLMSALRARQLDPRAVILSLSFHLGARPQTISVLDGYEQAAEDHLLEMVDWTEDGYRLFDISVFAPSSSGGWFEPISESNAIFMRKALWEELNGFDELFTSPGGGLVNLDLLARAVSLPNVQVATLLGEGTFHQVHGGVATNALRPITHKFFEEYARLRGRSFEHPVYDTIYVGQLHATTYHSVARSVEQSNVQGRVYRKQPKGEAWPQGDSTEGLFGNIRAASADTPAALLVIGMHRSGTSALAGLLCQLGYGLPGKAVASAPDNPKGYFESAWVQSLNERILRRLGSAWNDPLPSCPDWTVLRLDDLHALLRAKLQKAFADSPFLVIKDPRLCLLAPMWKEALAGLNRPTACILPVRHPAEVAHSLLARDGINLAHSFAMWLKHVLSAERATRADRRCVIGFSQLLEDWKGAIDIVSNTLGVTWPTDEAIERSDVDGFVERGLRHHQNVALRPEVAIEVLCGEAWEALQRLTADANDPQAIRSLNDIHGAFQSAGALWAPLIAATAPLLIEPALAPHLDGMRILVPGRPEVWLVFHGQRHHIVSSKAYDALFSGISNLITMPTVSHIQRGSDVVDDACLIRSMGTPDIFLLNGNPHLGFRRHLIKLNQNCRRFDFDFAKVRELPQLVVDAIPEGRPLC